MISSDTDDKPILVLDSYNSDGNEAFELNKEVTEDSDEEESKVEPSMGKENPASSLVKCRKNVKMQKCFCYLFNKIMKYNTTSTTVWDAAVFWDPV